MTLTIFNYIWGLRKNNLMNKEKQLKELVNYYGIDVIRKELNIIENKEIPKRAHVDWFKSLLFKMIIKQDQKRFPNFLFFFIGNNLYMDYDVKNNIFGCSYPYIWSNIQLNFGLSDEEISDFIKNQVEKHFKMEINTPGTGLESFVELVEEHFKTN